MGKPLACGSAFRAPTSRGPRGRQRTSRIGDALASVPRVRSVLDVLAECDSAPRKYCRFARGSGTSSRANCCRPAPPFGYGGHQKWRLSLVPRLLEAAGMVAYIPSLKALESDDGQLVAELRLTRLRSQVAVVRALADHVDYLARPADAEGLGNQVVEEMARLGCRLLEAAGAFAASPRPSNGGAHERLREDSSQVHGNSHTDIDARVERLAELSAPKLTSDRRRQRVLQPVKRAK
jgi:hypothetical protein